MRSRMYARAKCQVCHGRAFYRWLKSQAHRRDRRRVRQEIRMGSQDPIGTYIPGGDAWNIS